MRNEEWRKANSEYRTAISWLGIGFKDCVGEIEEAEDGREDGGEFAAGDDPHKEEGYHDHQERSSQEGGAPVAEEPGFHELGSFLMRWEER